MSQQATVIDEKLEQLERMASTITHIYGSANAWLESFPLPAWIKTPNGEMARINKAYSKAYEIHPDEYIGRKDVKVWEEGTAAGFAENDRKIMESDSYGIFQESLPQGHLITVLKFPVYDEEKFLGVGGVVLDDGRAKGIPRIGGTVNKSVTGRSENN